MRLVRLVYASKFNIAAYDTSELAKIKEIATTHNTPASISGILVLGNDCFLQCLEGGREAVNKLYNKIAKDPRHTSILLLSYSEVSKREFGEWSMKCIMLTKEKRDLIKRYSTTENFNPFDMSGISAYEFLKALHEA